MVCIADIVELLGADLVFPYEDKANQNAQEGIDFTKKIIHSLADLKSANAEQISFVAQDKYLKDLHDTKALAVIINKQLVEYCPVPAMVVDDAYLAFAKVSGLFAYKKCSQGIAATAQIHHTSKIGNAVSIAQNVVIGAYCDIGDGCIIHANTVIEDYVTIGAQTEIQSNVSIAHHCQIGENVCIHNNASIGAEGFGFAPDSSSAKFQWHKISQLGSVIIGDNVRIGANTCIDRGALGDTVIEEGVIIDNLVQIAHNVHIGEHTAIAACVGISGSTRIGKYCVLAGGVGVVGHITIVDRVTITGRTVVTGSINKAGSYSSGTIIMPTVEWRKAAVNFKKLAKSPFRTFATEINDLKTRLKRVESSSQD